MNVATTVEVLTDSSVTVLPAAVSIVGALSFTRVMFTVTWLSEDVFVPSLAVTPASGWLGPRPHRC
ncbi:hypothetical protein AL546_007360 [Vibrio vulnificus]|nr:hypothetical protein AL546_007345 [Vibrio vulnificus]PNM58514.1 hypothetical protein AL546_007360 [Vibrio vulnificus]PNM97147.1 hypothetical protein AL547_023620 [Vibrio vulnificus]